MFIKSPERIQQIATEESTIVLPLTFENYIQATKSMRVNEFPPLIGTVIYDNTIRFNKNIEIKVSQREGIMIPGQKVVVFNFGDSV